jgi:hypothetical protein
MEILSLQLGNIHKVNFKRTPQKEFFFFENIDASRLFQSFHIIVIYKKRVVRRLPRRAFSTARNDKKLVASVGLSWRGVFLKTTRPTVSNLSSRT